MKSNYTESAQPSAGPRDTGDPQVQALQLPSGSMEPLVFPDAASRSLSAAQTSQHTQMPLNLLLLCDDERVGPEVLISNGPGGAGSGKGASPSPISPCFDLSLLHAPLSSQGQELYVINLSTPQTSLTL